MAHPPIELDPSLQADRSIDHILGPLTSPITLIEYGDLQCPSCKQAQAVLLMLRARYAQDVKFVFRHFPLTDVHPYAGLAAEAAEAAGAQGKFWDYVDLLFERQPNLQPERLDSYAQDLRLDVDRFRDELKNHTYEPRVHRHMALGNQLRVRGTPTFYVNGRLVDASFGLRQLHVAVENAIHGDAQAQAQAQATKR
jgi:protein-disulfide isomerase